tara:strand:+ start:5375 stop:6250 length:876 start_codon:yes stop_codon:yes gene_type:complete
MSDIEWNHQYAELPSVKIHYVRHGAGHPIILCHGYPEFWYVYHKNIPALAEHFDVIALDWRGFGDSENPEQTPTVDDYVGDLAALIDHLGLDRVGLVGHDFGPWIIQEYARRHPERISGLFLYSFPYPQIGDRWYATEHVKEVWYQAFQQLPFAAEIVSSSRDNCRAYISHFLSHWGHDPHAFDDDLEVWVDNFMKPGNVQGGFNWYRANHENRIKTVSGGLGEMAPITVPTCVRWGEHDPLLKVEWRDRLGECFADVDVEVFEGVGHYAPYEAPDRANAVMIKFFNKVVG